MVPWWAWAGFVVFVLLLLALDLGLLHRKPRAIPAREALLMTAFYIVLAGLFAIGVFQTMGREAGLEFVTGYLVEKSLSLDNVFVMALIFGHFGVPAHLQHRVLFWGILGALVTRAVLIGVGAALVSEFGWILYLFGAFLVVTGLKMLFSADEDEPDPAESWIARTVRRRVRMTPNYEGQKFFVRRDGVLMATPLLLVLVMIECTDIVFALDSIPAIFAITTDPFLIFTSNVFAILGLRALYFALADLIGRFVYLKYGLALTLTLVGAKMLVADFWHMPTAMALGAIVVLIGGSVVVSLLWPPRSVRDPLPPSE